MLRDLPGEVILWELIDVERHEIDLRAAPLAVPGITGEEPVDEVLRVGKLEHHSAEECDLLTARFCSA